MSLRPGMIAALALVGCASLARAQAPAPDWFEGALERRARRLRAATSAEAASATADLAALAALPAARQAQIRRLLSIVGRTPAWLLRGAVVDTRRAALTSLPALGPRLAAARMIHVGERHDRAADHRLQQQVVELLGAYPGRTAVGFEMFARPVQPVLDAHAAGKLTEKAFLEQVDWKRSWGFPWPLYAGIVRAARHRRMGLVALNIPRTLIRQVTRQGLDGLPPELRRRLPADVDLKNAAHRQRFLKMMGSHPGMDPVKLDRYYQSMVVWDEVMAESATRWLKAHPRVKRMVVVAGTGHVAHRTGIPERAARRGGAPYLILIPRSLGPDPVRMTLADLLRPPGDYVVFTELEPR